MRKKEIFLRSDKNKTVDLTDGDGSDDEEIQKQLKQMEEQMRKMKEKLKKKSAEKKTKGMDIYLVFREYCEFMFYWKFFFHCCIWS